ncbi:ParB/RepB/Spo0J family partition protein [Chitinispirillales bacterium ANBcel5]|uniref:ParB/RepB/Spo0J family partition protein n=1 Tax=Cellulosispirillum alkaliphilum TaxID=3039283 RepID=UPI002A52D5BE|nr:ParB/RepB/Spo0J family partition protein [Chitinispirillales bacterium ANBcel5]
MNKRKALGRGLSNLIPTQDEENVKDSDIVYVERKSIKTNPYQPRIDFDEEEIKNLATSIENQGLLQPIVLRKKDNHYEIISGERRFRAFGVLGRDKVPCILKNKVTDREMLELALVENIQREELNEIEKAIAYQKLILECSYTHDQLSKQIGKSRAAITNSLRILNLPDEIQQMVRKAEISMGHARALLSIEKEDQQLKMAKRIVDDKLSVRDVEKISQDNRDDKPKTKPSLNPEPVDPDIADLIEKLQYKYGTSVKIKPGVNGDKGKLELHYFSKDDLVRVVDLLIK